jgi:NADPH:quinone reductase
MEVTHELYLHELGSEPASVGLGRLADLVASGQLAPHISLERPWKEIGQVAQELMDGRFPGKAVLTVE